jgi:hypothetical protein
MNYAKHLLLSLALVCSLMPFHAAHSQQTVSHKTLFISADPSFQTALTAAMIKKDVPVSIVSAPANAVFTLRAAAVASKAESTGSKIARCAFAYCAGMNGSSSVSVELIDNASGSIVWAYQVRKGNAGPVGIQSLSEAIAKHLKNDYLKKQQ